MHCQQFQRLINEKRGTKEEPETADYLSSYAQNNTFYCQIVHSVAFAQLAP
jgi:hypothetical protein